MSDRLKELQRQRALAQEQLAWLDREIARESGDKVTPAAPADGGPSLRPVPPSAAPSADDILAQYQNQAQPVHSEVKRGCFLYFFAALGLLVLSLAAFWFLRRH